MNRMEVVLGHTTEHQVVFVGPFGVGKTTALRTVSDIPVVDTDVASAEAMASGGHGTKTTTTAGFDYGEWTFPDGGRVSLIGVPGQDRFEAMWDLVLPRSSAIVLWLYGDRDRHLLECKKWLDVLAARKAIARLAVAVTRLPSDGAEELLNPYREAIRRFHPLAPVITADPREVTDVLQVVTMALCSPYAALERL
ncbi:MAG: hypothetical protein HYZ17_13855 [Betaproteobacteria bacterium]|nr:hypothetical protein [Betaproteobacteria bacterium]